KESAVIIFELGKRSRLRRREGKRIARRIIAVSLEFLYCAAPRLVRLGAAVRIEDAGRRAAQVVGREVRPKICAVAKNGAVLHQSVAKENLLAAEDIIVREQHSA